MNESALQKFLANVPSDSPLRGDYHLAGDDFTLAQDYSRYTEDEQQRWRALYARQEGLLQNHADVQFINGLKLMDSAQAIPHFSVVNERLMAATGFKLVAVPGLIPADFFFAHLAKRQFPVSYWLRRADEMDYLVEPDMFHDFFGHVPLLFLPVFADFMQAYGETGLRLAHDEAAMKCLSRLYWYTVEFGLINTAQGVRAFGSGILSSYAETQYAVTNDKPHRIGLELNRVMTTDYRIDDFQETYFVLRDYQQFFDITRTNLLPIIDNLKTQSVTPPHQKLPSDQLYAPAVLRA